MSQNRTAHQADAGSNQKPEKPRTDWLAWSLQLAFGSVIGFGAAFSIARLLFRSGFISANQMVFIMLGGASCCGAFASYYGDRAWMRSSVFDSPEPLRSELARKWSMRIAGFGGLLIILPIGLHLMTNGLPASRPGSGELIWFKLSVAAIPGGLLFHALRTGTGFWRWGILDRGETSLFYWIYVVVLAVATFCLLLGR